MAPDAHERGVDEQPTSALSLAQAQQFWQLESEPVDGSALSPPPSLSLFFLMNQAADKLFAMATSLFLCLMKQWKRRQSSTDDMFKAEQIASILTYMTRNEL